MRWLFFIPVFIACRVTHCSPADAAFVKQFEANMATIQMYETGDTPVGGDDYRNALFYLSRITGRFTRAEYGNIPRYRSREEYKADMKVWKNWFQKNKCHYTKAMADSIMAARIQ